MKRRVLALSIVWVGASILAAGLWHWWKPDDPDPPPGWPQFKTVLKSS